MRRLALLSVVGLAAACGPGAAAEVIIPHQAPLAEPPSPPERKALRDPLAEDVASRTPRRALLRWAKTARYQKGGGAVSDGDPTELDPPIEVIVVEEGPSDVRAVLERENVRVLLSIERADIKRVPTRFASLLVEPSAGAASGARVAPGVSLDEKQRRGSLVELSGVIDAIEVKGWLDASIMGEVFEHAASAPVKPNGLVAAGTSFYNAPNGALIASIASDLQGGLEAALLPGAPAGLQLVHLARKGVEVKGYVPAASARLRAPGDQVAEVMSGESFGFSTMNHATTAIVPAGHYLYDPEDAKRPVARARKDLVVYLMREVEKAPELFRVRVDVHPFGFLDAIARSPELRRTRAR